MQNEQEPDTNKWIPLLREALPPPFSHPNPIPYTSRVIDVERAIARALGAPEHELASDIMLDRPIDLQAQGMVRHYAEEHKRLWARNKQQQDSLPEEERLYQHIAISLELPDYLRVCEDPMEVANRFS